MQFAAAMRLVRLLAPSLLLVAACGPRGYRYEPVGTGVAGGPGVALATPGQHRVDWAITVPRSMTLEWTIDCGGAQVSGVAGETFEQYRVRRIGEIQAERERTKQAAATIGGAVLGTVAATGRVETDTGDAQVAAQADGSAVGYAVADAAMSNEITLPAGDVGVATYDGTVTVTATSPGACTMAVAPQGEDPTGVSGTYRVIRVMDRAAEHAAAVADARARAHAGSIEVRGRVAARLVAIGADPRARARRLAAEAQVRARAEAQARARAEAQAHARAELAARRQATIEARWAAEAEARARIWGEVWQTRQRALAYLVSVCGADPAALRRRLDAEAQAWAQAAAQAQARADAEARARAELVAAIERRDAAVRAVRAEIVARLLALGARVKTPMPDPVIEDPGDPPVAEAVWIDGGWVWRRGEWAWIAGHWSFPDHEYDVGVELGGGADVSVGANRDDDDDAPRPAVIDHRDAPTPVERPTVVDHRTPDPEPTRPKVRDHRSDNDDEKDHDTRPTTRDHRK